MIFKTTDGEGKDRSTCGHCGMSWSKHNATKMLWHAAKMKGKDMAPCKANIPHAYATSYADLWVAKQEAENLKKRRADELHISIATRDKTAGEEYLRAKMSFLRLLSMLNSQDYLHT